MAGCHRSTISSCRAGRNGWVKVSAVERRPGHRMAPSNNAMKLTRGGVEGERRW